MPQETFPAEPSDATMSAANSIAGVTARLLRWGRIAPSGLARVEYVSARAQGAVIENLRREFPAQNIPFHEIELTPDTPAEQHVARLRETLGKLSPCVVSITGLNRAFPADVPLLDSLGTLNFFRDTLVHFDLRQIWWMQGEMGNTFHLYNPDFDRFFLVRLNLTEIPIISDAPRLQNTLPEGELLTYEEAQQTALYNRERFSKALQTHRSLSELMSLCVSVFKPLYQAGRIVEASERQEQLFEEMRSADYALDDYLESEPNLEQMERRDAENFNELSVLRWDQGRYAEGQALVERELKIKRHVLPLNHPDIATSLHNLAQFYHVQGRHDEAETLMLEALALDRNVLKPDHPDLATHLSNLARFYQARGRYDEAETSMQEALAIRQKSLSEGHPDIATSLSDLARLYQEREQYDKAEKFYLEALDIARKTLSPDHPSLATHLNNLAQLYDERGRNDEAEPLYRKALGVMEQYLGQAHPNTQIVRDNLERLLREHHQN